MLMGFGIFNLVEGVIDHQLLGIHHVNETVPRDQWIWWDLGFLIWGAAMLVGGWFLLRRGRQETSDEAGSARSGQARGWPITGFSAAVISSKAQEQSLTM
jgi:hypothetical protein